MLGSLWAAVLIWDRAIRPASPSEAFVLAGLALLGLRNDNSPEYMEKQYNIARVLWGQLALSIEAMRAQYVLQFIYIISMPRSSCTGSPESRAVSWKLDGARALWAQAGTRLASRRAEERPQAEGSVSHALLGFHSCVIPGAANMSFGAKGRFAARQFACKRLFLPCVALAASSASPLKSDADVPLSTQESQV